MTDLIKDLDARQLDLVSGGTVLGIRPLPFPPVPLPCPTPRPRLPRPFPIPLPEPVPYPGLPAS